MTASPAPSSSRSVAEISTTEIDSSCRLPLFALFGGAAFWLALSSVFGLIASLKFHSPQMLADCAMLGYGRTYPAWSNLLVYGFCIPTGLGVGLWLLARLGRTTLAQPFIVFVGAKLWHLGVLIGLIGILRGNTTGFEWLEMPRYAAVTLLIGYSLILICGFMTHRARKVLSIYPSQWFVLAALFWFAWIYSTAILLLEFLPVRGVVQASLAWWFSGNLLFVWLALTGLASAFYFLPKLSGRPLQSHYLALFTFLTILLFGTWVGIPWNAPLPAWMAALSGGAATAMLAPALAIAVCMLQTLRGAGVKCNGGPFCYVRFGLISLVLSFVLLAATGVKQISHVTDFTWFGTARTYLLLYGFFAMTMFGAANYILPRVAAIELNPKLVRLQFWCVMAGSLVLAVPLLIGGIVQGLKLLNPEIPIVDVANSTLMFLRIGTLGELAIAVGNLLFFLNVFALLVRYYRTVCTSIYLEATTQLETAEAKP